MLASLSGVAVRVMSDVYEESDHMMPVRTARTDTFLSPPSLSGGPHARPRELTQLRSF